MKFTQNMRLRLPQGFEQYDIEDHNFNYRRIDELFTQGENGGGICLCDTESGGVRAATLVIAPFDSSDKSKAGADVVLRGQQDGNEINAALSLLHNGGNVIFTEGRIVIGDTAVSVESDFITLSGMGTGISGDIIMHGSGCRLLDMTLLGGMLIVIGTGCRVSNVQGEGLIQLIGADGIIRDCTLSGNGTVVRIHGQRGRVQTSTLSSRTNDEMTACLELLGDNTQADNCHIIGVPGNWGVGVNMRGNGTRVNGCGLAHFFCGITSDNCTIESHVVTHNRFEAVRRGIWHIHAGNIQSVEIANNVFLPFDGTERAIRLRADFIGMLMLQSNRTATGVEVAALSPSWSSLNQAWNFIGNNRIFGSLDVTNMRLSHVTGNAFSGQSAMHGIDSRFTNNIGTFFLSGSNNTIDTD